MFRQTGIYSLLQWVYIHGALKKTIHKLASPHSDSRRESRKALQNLIAWHVVKNFISLVHNDLNTLMYIYQTIIQIKLTNMSNYKRGTDNQ